LGRSGVILPAEVHRVALNGYTASAFSHLRALASSEDCPGRAGYESRCATTQAQAASANRDPPDNSHQNCRGSGTSRTCLGHRRRYHRHRRHPHSACGDRRTRDGSPLRQECQVGLGQPVQGKRSAGGLRWQPIARSNSGNLLPFGWSRSVGRDGQGWNGYRLAEVLTREILGPRATWHSPKALAM